MGCCCACRNRRSKSMLIDLSDAIPELSKIAKKHGIKNLDLSVSFLYQWKKFDWIEGPPNATIIGNYDLDNTDGPIDFIYETDKLLETVIVLVKFDLYPLYKGSIFPKLEGLIPIKDKACDPVDILFNQNEITLIHFWATWNYPSQELMVKSRWILKKHPEYSQKIQIIGISFDQQIDYVRNKIEKQKWPQEYHYWMQVKFQEEILKKFRITNVPFSIFVNSDGVIVDAGVYKAINLEDRIETLVLKLQSKESNELFKENPINFEQCKNSMREFINSHADNYSKLKDPELEIKCVKKLEDGILRGSNIHMLSSFGWELENKQEVVKIKNDLISTFGTKLSLEFKENGPKILKYGEKCTNCGIFLKNCDQFRCVCCPEIYFCYSCVEKRLNPRVVEDLIHNHALLFLVKDSSDLFEKSAYTYEMNEFSTLDRVHYSIMCEYCKQTPEGIRWKCLTCSSFNICNDCFEKGRKNKLDENKNQEHNFLTHSYIRIDFNRFVIE